MDHSPLMFPISNLRSKISTWASAVTLTDWLLASSFVLSLIAYAYLGFYSRYMADDFSALKPVRTHGFVAAQILWYRGWTGRFSFTFLYGLMALLGPATPRFIPALLLILWFSGAAWAIYQIQCLAGRVSTVRAALFAGLLIWATLETAPNVSQSLYWQNSALTHTTPFILLSLYIGLISRGMRERHKGFSYKFNLVCAGTVTFLAGGLSDTYVVMQSFALILFLLALEIFAAADLKSRLRPFLITGLIGALLSLAIVALAPGNSIRRAYFPRQFVGWDILAVTVSYSVRFLAKLVLTHPITFLTVLLLPLLIAFRDFSRGYERGWNRRLCIRLLMMIPVAVFLLIMCCTGTSVYAIWVMLPERAQSLLSLIFVCGTALWGRAAGEYLAGKLLTRHENKQRISRIAMLALLLLVLSPLVSFFSIFGLRQQALGFAADWDKQDSELKTAKQRGVTDVVVPQIGDFQSRIGKGPSDLHLRTDPEFWINQTIATYYGLRSVRASDDVSVSH
jgi:hypothetical protein